MNVADVVQADFVAEVSRDETEVGKNVAAALPKPPLPRGLMFHEP
jgi:hypothetical protein